MTRKFLVPLFIIPTFLIFLTACGNKNASGPIIDPSKPGTANYFYNEGILSFNSGDLTKARQHFSAALAKAPGHLDATLGMGLVHLASREFDQSLVYFERLKQLTPDNYDVYNYMGIIHMELGQISAAREHLLIAATSEKYPTPENAYANLATLELKQGNPDAALRYIGKGLEKKKSFPLLHSLEGQVFETRKQWPEALAAYERASTLAYHKDLGMILRMARMYRQMGEREKALDLLEKSLGKASNDEERQAVIALIAELNR
jgi:Tfp pilus assembly protein PilF